MNSKQRRKNRRKSKVEGIVDNFYSAKMMNDFCVYIYDCKNAEFEMKCFGRYENCKRYQTGDLTIPVNSYKSNKKT